MFSAPRPAKSSPCPALPRGNWKNPRGAAGQNWLQIALIPLFITPANHASEEESVSKSFYLTLHTDCDYILHKNGKFAAPHIPDYHIWPGHSTRSSSQQCTWDYYIWSDQYQYHGTAVVQMGLLYLTTTRGRMVTLIPPASKIYRPVSWPLPDWLSPRRSLNEPPPATMGESDNLWDSISFPNRWKLF